jgi:hypothetical protein
MYGRGRRRGEGGGLAVLGERASAAATADVSVEGLGDSLVISSLRMPRGNVSERKLLRKEGGREVVRIVGLTWVHRR